jgi:hypothetical protein
MSERGESEDVPSVQNEEEVRPLSSRPLSSSNNRPIPDLVRMPLDEVVVAADFQPVVLLEDVNLPASFGSLTLDPLSLSVVEEPSAVVASFRFSSSGNLVPVEAQVIGEVLSEEVIVGEEVIFEQVVVGEEVVEEEVGEDVVKEEVIGEEVVGEVVAEEEVVGEVVPEEEVLDGILHHHEGTDQSVSTVRKTWSNFC